MSLRLQARVVGNTLHVLRRATHTKPITMTVDFTRALTSTSHLAAAESPAALSKAYPFSNHFRIQERNHLGGSHCAFASSSSSSSAALLSSSSTPRATYLSPSSLSSPSASSTSHHHNPIDSITKITVTPSRNFARVRVVVAKRPADDADTLAQSQRLRDNANKDPNAHLVFVDRKPFNSFWQHATPYVIPLEEEHRGDRPGRMLLLIYAVCIGMFFFFQTTNPVLYYDALGTYLREEKYMERWKMQPDERMGVEKGFEYRYAPFVEALAQRYAFIIDNFTSSLHRNLHAPWTMFTSSLMHMDLGHLFSNCLSLFVFAPKVYSFLGPRAFGMLFISGAVGCSLVDSFTSLVQGKTGPPPDSRDLFFLSYKLPDPTGHAYETYEQLSQLKENSPKSSVGMSGANMAVAMAAAIFFPNDKVFAYLRYIPVPYIVALYMALDTYAVYKSDKRDRVNHVGHLGGALFGALFSACVWYLPVARNIPYKRFGAHLPIMSVRGWTTIGQRMI